MRHQIVIMLLGLMTILSLSAFANVKSRESNHATQPYKYITLMGKGKRLGAHFTCPINKILNLKSR